MVCTPQIGDPRYSLSSDIQSDDFDLSPHSHHFITVDGFETSGNHGLYIGTTMDYATNALRLSHPSCPSDEVVTDRIGIQTSLALGLGRFAELALRYKAYPWIDGGAPVFIPRNRVDRAASGDLRLSGKFKLLNERKYGFGFATIPSVNFPTGSSENGYVSEGWAIKNRFVVDWQYMWRRIGLAMALNADISFYPNRINDAERFKDHHYLDGSGPLGWGTGFAARLILPRGFSFVGEINGGGTFSDNKNLTHVDISGAVQIQLPKMVSLIVGGRGSPTSGIGDESWGIFAGANWAFLP